MRQNNYNLRDWGYFKLLQMIAEGMDHLDINYALVGGGAIQAQIVNVFNNYENVTAPDVSELLLRKTKDFDITTRSNEVDLIHFLNMVQLENEPLSIRPKQPRRVNMTYRGRRGTEPISVMLNYQIGVQDFSGLGEEFYNDCLDTAEDLYLNYNNEDMRVRVATPECIVASKLTRASPKDIVDISMLLKVLTSNKSKGVRPFNYDLVKSYLKEAGKEYCYETLATIVAEVLKE